MTSKERPGRFQELVASLSRRDFVRFLGLGAASSALLAGGGALLEACSVPGPRPAPPSPNPRRGGHVVEAAYQDITTTNPILVADVYSSEISGMLYDSLLASRANGDLYGLLASDWKAASDGLTYTLTLRGDARFSDGSPLTADDVKFTYDLMFDPAYKAVNSPARGDLEEYVQAITARDARTVIFQMKKVFAPFASAHLQYGILPKRVWGNLSPQQVNTTELNSAPTVTSGAWRFVRWDKGQQVVLAANRDYYGGGPYLDGYTYRKVDDAVAAANQLKSGEADLAMLDPTTLADVQANPEITIVSFPVAIFTFYGYNQNPGSRAARIFSDKSVRQALLYALNRQQMADVIYFKQAVVAASSVPPFSWAYDRDVRPQYAFDVARAESMLDAAGWKRGPDGIRASSTGQRLSFTIATNAGNRIREDLVVAMQDMWRRIGVDCTPQLITFPQLVAQITTERTFDVFVVGFSWGQDPDQTELWHSRNTAPGGFNGFGYKSQQMDTILDQAVATLDEGRRRQLYFQMQELLNDDVPAPVLVFNKGLWGFGRRLQGYSAGGGLGIGTYTQSQCRQWLNRAWVEDGR